MGELVSSAVVETQLLARKWWIPNRQMRLAVVAVGTAENATTVVAVMGHQRLGLALQPMSRHAMIRRIRTIALAVDALVIVNSAVAGTEKRAKQWSMSTPLLVVAVGATELVRSAVVVTRPRKCPQTRPLSISTRQTHLAVVAVGGTENAISAVAAAAVRVHLRLVLTPMHAQRQVLLIHPPRALCTSIPVPTRTPTRRTATKRTATKRPTQTHEGY